MEGVKTKKEKSVLTRRGRPTSYDRRFLIAGMVVVGFLVLANIWMVQETFITADGSALPKIELSPLKTTSLIFSGRENLKNNTWQSPKNILILGRAGEGNRAPNLTDTIIVAHVDPNADQSELKLVSIPRDLLVKLENPERYLKINALWPYATTLFAKETDVGIAIVKEKIEEVTSLSIDSVLVFDLNTVRSVIEIIDGVTVYVEDIHDPRFPTPSGGYETFSLKEGWRYLSAAEAIKFVRTRYSPSGDFDRIRHQQELLRAIKGKVASLNPVWDFPTLWSIFKIVRNDLVSDLTLDDAKNLWLVANQVSLGDIETMSLDVASTLVKPKTVRMSGLPAYTLVTTDDQENMFDYTKIREEVREFVSGPLPAQINELISRQ